MGTHALQRTGGMYLAVTADEEMITDVTPVVHLHMVVVKLMHGVRVVAAGCAAVYHNHCNFSSNEGYIDFPILGKIKASGLSRWQLQEQITQALAEKKMLTDGLVTVEFMNFKVSILGEVTNPGTYTINSDKVTVLEAIAMAKDLTIFGERNHVYVIREENGQRKSYQLDLRSADIFKSPAYYLKQNDVVYVQPNSVRAGQSTINQNAMKSVSLWISIASLLTSIGVLVVNIAKD